MCAMSAKNYIKTIFFCVRAMQYLMPDVYSQAIFF